MPGTFSVTPFNKYACDIFVGGIKHGSAELGFPLRGSWHEVTDEVLTLGNYSRANLLFENDLTTTLS